MNLMESMQKTLVFEASHNSPTLGMLRTLNNDLIEDPIPGFPNYKYL